MHEPSVVFGVGAAERRTSVRREASGAEPGEPRHQRAELELRAPSAAARERMRSRRGELLFVADWERALMLHLEVDADELQRAVPFPLDLRDGRAFVTLVAFTLRGMRPAFGGRVSAWLMKPIATHHFLNVRAYVRHRGEPGIFFLAEWLSNRLAVKLGPPIFGLPYHLGRLDYAHDYDAGHLRGTVRDVRTGDALEYSAELADRDEQKRTKETKGNGSGFVLSVSFCSNSSSLFGPCAVGSLDEWLMERYTAFTHHRGRSRFFRVWHESWPQARAEARITRMNLLTQRWPLFRDARLVGANFSPGARGVWMGRPHRV